MSSIKVDNVHHLVIACVPICKDTLSTFNRNMHYNASAVQRDQDWMLRPSP